MVGVSAVLHVLVLVLLVALELIRPRPETFRDVLTVDLVAPPPQAPEAVVVPRPEAAPPPPPEAAAPPPRPERAPLEASPLWAKLESLKKPPPPPKPKVREPSLADLWKDVAKAPPKREAPPPKTPPSEDLSKWWEAQMKTAAAQPSAPLPEPVDVPEREALAESWSQINATLPEAVRLGEEEIQAGASGELAEWWRQQVDMALAPDRARATRAAASGGSPAYLAAVEQRIGARWSPPDIFRDRKAVQVVLAFELSRDGHVRKVAIQRSSGSSFYDQAGLRAIYLSDPFPPFPEDLDESRMDINITLSLDRGRPG
jgi:protein TonB